MEKTEKEILGEEGFMNSMPLESMLSKITIPPLPANRLQLLEITRQPESKIDLKILNKLVSTDPGLFAMVMKLANSSYYRGIEEIISVRSAIARIGLRDTIDAISFFCVQDTLPVFPTTTEFSSEAYWTFSWACAMAARRLGHPNLGMNILPGALYMAGLLHGIGKLMMAIYCPKEFEICLIRSKKMMVPLYKVEQEVFGTINGFIAARIMKSWNFPDTICAGVAFYQKPESAPSEHREMAGLIQFAVELTLQADIGENGEIYRRPLSKTLMGRQPRLKLSKESIQTELVREIQQTVAQKYESVAGAPFPGKKEQSPRTATGSGPSPTSARRPFPPASTHQAQQGIFTRLMAILKRLLFL